MFMDEFAASGKLIVKLTNHDPRRLAPHGRARTRTVALESYNYKWLTPEYEGSVEGVCSHQSQALVVDIAGRSDSILQCLSAFTSSSDTELTVLL